MKKLFTCAGIILALRLGAYAQQTPLSEQAGVKISYQATKLEEDKKHDKWKIDVFVDNDAPQDVAYTGNMDYDQISKVSSPPRYLKVEVTNSKGLFTISFKEFRGGGAPYLAADGSNVFLVPKGRITESFNTNIEKGATPALKADFLANIRSVNDIPLLRANPVEVATRSRMFLIYEGNNPNPRTESSLKVLTWDNTMAAVSFDGSQFTIAPNGDFNNAQKSDVVNFLGWDKTRMTARFENNLFVIFRNGDYSNAMQEGGINFVGADGYNLQARMAPFVSNKLTPGEKLRPMQRLTSNNGQYWLMIQADGNLVLNNSQSQPIWASGTNGHGISHLIMQNDGNLVLYQMNNAPDWSSATSGGGNYLVVQDDGNMVVYKPDGNGAWSTRTRGR
jgi:hypothetical protein